MSGLEGCVLRLCNVGRSPMPAFGLIHIKFLRYSMPHSASDSLGSGIESRLNVKDSLAYTSKQKFSYDGVVRW